jgi:hypothetical protein
MKVVAAYTNSEQAYLAASRLESAGIAVEIRDAGTITLNWMWAPAIGGVKVAVADEDFADALEILNAPTDNQGILKCPHCGSSDGVVRTLSPAAALFLVVNIPLPIDLQTADCRTCAKSYGIRAHPHWGASARAAAKDANTTSVN